MTTQAKQRTQISIDVAPELRRRIEVAAAAQDRSVNDYVERLVQEALLFDQSQPLPATDADTIVIPPMTPEEQERGLQALADLTRIRQELLAKHGRLEPESWVLLNESRDERTRDLMRALEE